MSRPNTSARTGRALALALGLFAACGSGGLTQTNLDARPAGDDGGPGPDGGPTGFVPDRVTMAEALPAVVPVLKVSLGGQTIERDVEIAGSIQIFEDHDGTLTDLGGATPTLTSPLGFQGRGNFTWSLPKQGYAFELKDDAGLEVERSILGLPPGGDFALYACYTDKTCLRYALVMALGQGLGRWSPRTRFVELYLDDEYRGLYMLLERIRRDGDRVDLPRPADSAGAGDLTGGYVVRHEGAGNGAGDFTTTAGTIYTFHVPRPESITPEQDAYVRAAMQRMEDELAAAPSAHAGLIDVTSWIDRGIVEEVTNNWDGYVHSIYMTKDADADGGRFGMGPLWDFDLAFANGNVTGYNCRTDVWAHAIERGYPDDVPAYWRALYREPSFQAAWGCRYRALRGGPLALATFDARIDAWVAFTASARARDQARWPTIGQSIFPNCSTEPSYDADVAALRAWIAARLLWLDGQADAMAPSCP